MAGADIVIDRGEIENLKTWLNSMGVTLADLNGGGTGSVSQLTLDGLTVKGGGPDFLAGSRVVTAVQKVGTDVLARLTKMQTETTNLEQKLQQVLDRSEHIDNLNQLAASEFAPTTTPAV